MGWHLRTGEWMLAHGSLPQVDPFSVSGQGQTWIAYSWLFEVILQSFYQALGLPGIVALTTLMGVAITLGLLSLLGKLNADPGVAIGLTGLGVFSMSPLLQTPRPWLFSILFFILELRILLNVSQDRQFRRLIPLIPLFWLWANLQIQFIYGLLLLVVFILEPLATQSLHQLGLIKQHPEPWGRPVFILFAFCFLATVAGPYHVKLYIAIYEVLFQTGVYRTISEMQAVPFRGIPDWLFLVTAIGAAFWLGKISPVKSFLTLVYLGGLFVAFRSQRDTYFLIVPALAIIATGLPHAEAPQARLFTWPQQFLAGVLLGIAAFVLVLTRDLTTAGLEKVLAEDYPASAVYVVRLHQLPGPLYNHYDYGGFLMWRLPEYPIGIDGRANFYGDQRINQVINTLKGRHDWLEDPELIKARLVITKADDALSSLLKLDHRFELVFEDKVSSVFKAKGHPASAIDH